MKAPFPWFGGKSKVAPLVWSRFGDVPNYCEPFFGSGAVMLARPHWPFRETITETINDRNCYVANFWRAIENEPEAVAAWADGPVNEADLHAKHTWLHGQSERMERLKTDPDFYDARVAGYWCWGLSCWIGDNWCRPTRQNGLPHLGSGKGVNRQLPHLGNPGMVENKRPHLSTAGKGIERKLPGETSGVPGGCQDRHERLLGYFRQIADRLRGVRVCCGDWTRILGPSPTHRLGMTGVFLDPPYADDGQRDMKIYGEHETNCWPDVCRWCEENGDNPLLRISLCGYEGGWNMPVGWDCVPWKAGGGYANLNEENQNRHRERIWFNRACIKTELDLFP